MSGKGVKPNDMHAYRPYLKGKGVMRKSKKFRVFGRKGGVGVTAIRKAGTSRERKNPNTSQRSSLTRGEHVNKKKAALNRPRLKLNVRPENQSTKRNEGERCRTNHLNIEKLGNRSAYLRRND